MHFSFLLILIVLGGCATKYTVPTNRFFTPESQGGFLRSQLELQKTQSNQWAFDANQSEADGPLIHSVNSKVGFDYSTSIFNAFDFVWTHVGHSNSLLGGKFQIIGDPKLARATGHKLAVMFLMGGNEHEPANKSVNFRLDGREWLLLYGYRLDAIFLPYVSFGESEYTFEVVPSVSHFGFGGYEVTYKNKVRGLNTGVEAALGRWFAKVELSYQQITTTNSDDKTVISYGLAGGVNW